MADDSRVLKGYLSVFSGDLGRLLVFAVFIPLLVRVIGEGQYGYYALVMATFLPLRKLFNMGLFEASKTYVTRAEGDVETTLTTSSVLLHTAALVVGVPILVLVILAFPLEPVLQTSYLVIIPALVGEQLYNFGRGVLHSRGRESLVEPLIPLRSVILAAVGLWLAHQGYGVPGVFAGFAAGFMIAGVGAMVLAVREVGVPVRALITVDRESLQTLIRFGVPSMAMGIAIIGLYKTDVLLVGYFLSSTQTGYYRAALQVSEFIWVVAVAMEMMMIQTTTGLWSDGEHDKITELLGRMIKYVVLLTTLLVIGVFVLNDEFLRTYFGAGFIASEQPLKILLPGVLFFSVARVIWPVMQAGGHLRGLLGIIYGSLATNILLNLLLIPRFGIVGASISTSFSYGLMAVLHVWIARENDVRPLSRLPVVRLVAIAGITLAVLMSIDTRLGLFGSFTVVPIVGLILYSGLLVVFGVVSIKEARQLVDSVFESRISS
jgi:O-antigen/teichoic acid export membrane protein